MGTKKAVKKGKKKPRNKPTSKKYSKYKIEGDKVVRNAKFCPRCGPGIFLLSSNNRVYCGKCHYSEFGAKPEDKKEKSDDKVEEKSPTKK